jgi:glycosyltransferase involved in cell wall biosynthesis
MKILIYSHVFHPSVGGSETACRLLAYGFMRAGHQVRIVTQTPGEVGEFPFPVYRRPSKARLFRLVRWCDVYVHSNISLRGAWPLLLLRRPWIIIHHSRIQRLTGELIWADHLKRYVTRFATNIAVSQSMADELPVRSEIVGNGYADDVFFRHPNAVRSRELVFLGRLNFDKGAHLIIEALARLKQRGRLPSLTIIGFGAERDNLVRLAAARGVQEQVIFTGKMAGPDLARLLNSHRIMVVPSLVAETFGIVAMEGIACGCAVVASDVGALVETVGPCGVNFPTGDVEALTQTLADLLDHPERIEAFQRRAPEHLRPFKRDAAVAAYLRIIEAAAGCAPAVPAPAPAPASASVPVP